MKDKFILRKIKQLGEKLSFRLIDANNPAEIFVELLKYRNISSQQRDAEFLGYVIQHYKMSKSQLFQDILVLYLTSSKQEGFFVEFGATDGLTLSNTFLLEKSFGWQGILAEPARVWHKDLHTNRGCIIDTRCVYSKTGELLEFNETKEGELSTIGSFSSMDGHAAARTSGSRYTVESVSLEDLLVGHDAPHTIDYLSIDTEGSELEILSSFNFQKYDIRIITIEHNFTSAQEKIHTLLTSNGYIRVFEGFSQWDDWYLKPEGESWG